MRRSAAGLEHGAHGLERGHAEVGDLDVVLVVEQQVLGLEVAVADGVAVAEVQRRDDLPEKAARLLRRQPALLHQVVERLAARHVL